MTRTFAIAMLAAIFVGIGAGQTVQTKVNSEEKAIRKILLERVESFNRHEPTRASAYTADADFVNVYGMWRKGPAEIESGQKERMQTALKDAKMTLRELRIRFIKRDVAIVHQRHDMSGMRDAVGKTMPTLQELSVRVMVKENGKWLTTAFHNTIVRPAAPRTPAVSSRSVCRAHEKRKAAANNC